VLCRIVSIIRKVGFSAYAAKNSAWVGRMARLAAVSALPVSIPRDGGESMIIMS